MVRTMATDSMVKPKHRPPSRVKYEQNNPPVTIRLTKNLRDTLDPLRGEQSYPRFIKTFLKNTADQINAAAVEAARKKGYAAATKRYKITFPCGVCGNDLGVSETNLNDVEIIAVLRKSIKDWHHGGCHR